MNVFLTFLCLVRTSAAVQLANSLSWSSIYHMDRAPSGVCNFSDSGSAWARYLNASKSGRLIFHGNGMGQGAGNVLAGVSTALMFAMASRRELVIDYTIGGVQQLSDAIPANKDGPPWKYVPHESCSRAPLIKDFDFGRFNTKPEDAVKIAMDVTRHPVVCHEGNFGHNEHIRDLLNADLGFTPRGADYVGCSLNFLFDTTQVKTDLVSNVFNFVGHLRLGDSALMGAHNVSSSGRPFLFAHWGLHTIERAGARLVQCMQGVARSLPELHSRLDCTITIISDSPEMKRVIQSQSKEGQQRCAVRISNVEAKHSSFSMAGESQVQDMLSDLFSLGNADAAMLTDSGFGIVGSAMGPAMSQRSYQFEEFLKEYSLRDLSVVQKFEDFCFYKASKDAAVTFAESVRRYRQAKNSALWNA